MSAGALNHVTVPVACLDTADAYYGPLLQLLGYRKYIHVAEMRAWECAENGCSVILWCPVANDEPGRSRDGVRHVGFSVASRTMVDQCYQLVLGLAGRILQPPIDYEAPRCYACLFESAEGTLVEVVHSLKQPAGPGADRDQASLPRTAPSEGLDEDELSRRRQMTMSGKQ